jgi:hypothetical protein
MSVGVEGYQMTAQGPRKLGSERVDAGGGKGPGAAVPLGVAIATGNPIGLILSSGLKAYGEASGRSKIEGEGRPDREGNRQSAQGEIPATRLDQLRMARWRGNEKGTSVGGRLTETVERSRRVVWK